MDIIDALAQRGASAGWDLTGGGVSSPDLTLASHPSASPGSPSVWDGVLLRALEGERLHVNVRPAEEEEEEDDDEDAPEKAVVSTRCQRTV